MDILDSILNSMEKPPSVRDEEKIRLKKVKDAMMRAEKREKEMLIAFKKSTQEKLTKFEKSEEKKLTFPPLDKRQRTIVHEVAEDAGMLSYSFGEEDVDRYIIVYKKEFPPSEDELNALRMGEEWSEQKAKQLAEQRQREKEREKQEDKSKDNFVPASDYKEKYQHLIGVESAKEAARRTETNKQYGFVPSSNKKDSRSIEQTLADIRSRKKMKMNDYSL